MKKEWLKEIARDIIALGGIPFFSIVVIRIWLLDTPAYLSQFLIAGSLFLIATFLLKSSFYSGLSLISLFFTALVYADLRYTLFGSFVYLLLLGSLFYLNYNKKNIILGVILGAVTTVIGYYIVEFIF